MTKAVCIALLYIHAIIYFSSAKSQSVRTGQSVKTFWNGPDGECEAPSAKGYIRDGCSAGWKKKNTTKPNYSGRQTSENKSGCRYSEKTTLFSCSESKTAETTIICWKSVSVYIIRPTCAGVWLNWGECDAFCGVGTKTRLKFVTSDGKSYQQISEHRPCKIRSCGKWTDWSFEKNCSNGDCTRIFQRNCVYNSTVAPVKFCSGQIANGNATSDVFKIPCQSATEYDERGISTTTQSPSAANTSDTTVTNTTDRLSTTVFLNRPSKDATFSVLAVSQIPESTVDIWKGLLIGVFVASFLYGIIAIFIYYRRKSFSRRNSSDYTHYEHDKTEPGSLVIQEGANIENVPNTILIDASQTQTLPQSQLPPGRINTSPLPEAPLLMTHSNQLCNDETSDPLYSNIPAYENVPCEVPCHVAFTDSIGDWDDDDPRPDMFEGESESLDSEEMRDVLRTLKRPSSIFKKKAASLKESSISLLRSEFNRGQNDIARQKRSTIGTGSRVNSEVSKEFSWAKRSTFSGRVPVHKRTSNAHQPATSTGSITSLNVDTSGYNSSIADESTDDEYGGRILSLTSQKRQSRLRKSATFLRRKLSMSQNKIFANRRSAEDVVVTNRTPMRPQSENIQMNMTSEEFPICDTKPFSTMKPVRRQGFVVLSRNDRFVIVEDEYSLPIDAIAQVRPASPSLGYNIPIDALCKYSDPT